MQILFNYQSQNCQENWDSIEHRLVNHYIYIFWPLNCIFFILESYNFFDSWIYFIRIGQLVTHATMKT